MNARDIRYSHSDVKFFSSKSEYFKSLQFEEQHWEPHGGKLSSGEAGGGGNRDWLMSSLKGAGSSG